MEESERMTKITTIVFDLDGTLLNTLDDLADSTNYALAQFGFPTRSVEEVRRFVGNGVRKLMERAVPVRIVKGLRLCSTVLNAIMWNIAW